METPKAKVKLISTSLVYHQVNSSTHTPLSEMRLIPCLFSFFLLLRSPSFSLSLARCSLYVTTNS
jgi:hypothetical protein